MSETNEGPVMGIVSDELKERLVKAEDKHRAARKMLGEALSHCTDLTAEAGREARETWREIYKEMGLDKDRSYNLDDSTGEIRLNVEQDEEVTEQSIN